jgi:hypothetical protein
VRQIRDFCEDEQIISAEVRRRFPDTLFSIEPLKRDAEARPGRCQVNGLFVLSKARHY